MKKFNQKEKFSREKIDAIYKTLRKKQTIAKLLAILAIISFPLGIASIILSFIFRLENLTIGFFISFPIIFLGLLIGFAFVFYSYKNNFKENSMKSFILGDCEILEDTYYSSYGGISKEQIEQLGIYLLKYETADCNDKISARYNNIPFEQCDLKIGYVQHSSNGGSSEVVKFYGRWVTISFDEGYDYTLQIISNDYNKIEFNAKTTKEAEKYRLTTSNEEFNNLFRVYSKDGEIALSTLTPEFIYYILNFWNTLSKNVKKNGIVLVLNGNTLNVGVNNYEDAFEPKLFGKIDYELDKKRFLEDIKIVTTLIDCFYPSGEKIISYDNLG